MSNDTLPEFWLRGPVPHVPALLQPVAHALLQSREEITQLMAGFSDGLLWKKPFGLASVGFHLQHLSGVLDRLFTYAMGMQLTPAQFEFLAAEGKYSGLNATTAHLVSAFQQQVEKSLAQLGTTDEKSLTEYRAVGRGKLPSTVIGLLTHGAEHTMRHTGQLLVTVRCVRDAL